MKVLKNSVLNSTMICLIFGFVLVSVSGCWKTKPTKDMYKLKNGKLKVSQDDMAFSLEELRKEPGEEITFDFVNDLEDEKLRFYLLKGGEDPIVVQHIKAQQGAVPKEYFLFESLDVEPGQEIKVTFKAPTKEGVYSYVGVSETPRESLVGRLVIAKKELLEENQKKAEETVDKETEIEEGLTDDSN